MENIVKYKKFDELTQYEQIKVCNKYGDYKSLEYLNNGKKEKNGEQIYFRFEKQGNIIKNVDIIL